MAVALSLGPLRARRSDPLVLNNYLRRDIGIWSGLAGLVHLFVATELSMSRPYMEAYVNLSANGLADTMRMYLFSWGSIAGFLIGVLVLLLLVLSNNKIMRVSWCDLVETSAKICISCFCSYRTAWICVSGA